MASQLKIFLRIYQIACNFETAPPIHGKNTEFHVDPKSTVNNVDPSNNSKRNVTNRTITCGNAWNPFLLHTYVSTCSNTSNAMIWDDNIPFNFASSMLFRFTAMQPIRVHIDPQKSLAPLLRTDRTGLTTLCLFCRIHIIIISQILWFLNCSWLCCGCFFFYSWLCLRVFFFIHIYSRARRVTMHIDWSATIADWIRRVTVSVPLNIFAITSYLRAALDSSIQWNTPTWLPRCVWTDQVKQTFARNNFV